MHEIKFMYIFNKKEGPVKKLLNRVINCSWNLYYTLVIYSLLIFYRNRIRNIQQTFSYKKGILNDLGLIICCMA